MQVVYERCAGLDVHKKVIWACAIWFEQEQKRQEIRRFSTATGELLVMADWLRQHGTTHVVMEATGSRFRLPLPQHCIMRASLSASSTPHKPITLPRRNSSGPRTMC